MGISAMLRLKKEKDERGTEKGEIENISVFNSILSVKTVNRAFNGNIGDA